MNVGASELYGRFGMSVISLANPYIASPIKNKKIIIDATNFKKYSVYLQINNCVYND